MAEVVLEPSGIHPLVSKGVAASVAKHVDVNPEPELGGLACSFNHPGNAHSAEGCTAFVDEDIRAVPR